MRQDLVAVLSLIFAVSTASCLHLSPNDLDPLDSLSEADFENVFHEARADTPGEERQRAAALRENEAEVKETNAAYLAGELTWFDSINENANLPEAEFRREKTGALEVPQQHGAYARGLLEPQPQHRVDADSEHHFAQVRLGWGPVPGSYSSVAKGYVTPVKNQLNCGSCTAFASMAAVEVCYRKLTSTYGDYSEQQFVDCAYDQYGADGCNGAPAFSYLYWATKQNPMLANEVQYPYLNDKPKLSCPTTMPVYNQGARLNRTYYTYEANEDLLQKLVYNYGAAVTTVKAEGPFSLYGGGIFAGCPPSNDTDHAVAVVGYGTENGTDYWLIKNSWGTRWGENGYIRLKRGVGMCGIGQMAAVANCAAVPGPTDPPVVTTAPCFDGHSSCAWSLKPWCYKPSVQTLCPVTCGMCPGMTPAPSVTCYNFYANCNSLCNTTIAATHCKMACGLC